MNKLESLDIYKEDSFGITKKAILDEIKRLHKRLDTLFSILTKTSTAKIEIGKKKELIPTNYISITDFSKKYKFISDTTINRIVKEQSIPSMIANKKRYFHLDDFLNYIVFECKSSSISNKMYMFRSLVPELEQILSSVEKND